MSFETAILLLFVLFACGAGVWFLFFRPKLKKSETPYLLLQQQIEGLRGELRQTLEGNTQAVTEQLKNQLDLWQKTHQGMDHRLDNAAKVFVSMESRMVKVEEATRQVLEVGKDIATLQQILKAPKLRGNFSEQLLADLLSQMMPRENFELQYTFRSGERVDAVIHTAQGLVAIDAKFPLENFQRLVLEEQEDEKNGFRKLFLADVKKHIDDIASKYILPQEGTFEFALMYIPAENVYYEIVTQSVIHYALKKKVIPVSPNTFYAYLQTILLGLRGMQVEKRVGEIVAEIARLRKEMGVFRIDFSKLGKHLSDSLSSFEKSDRRLARLEEKLGTLEVGQEPVSAPVLPESKEKSSEVSGLLES